MKQLVFFPTYNEEGNVASMLDRIALALPTAEILVIDDGSRDGTLEILTRPAQRNLKILVRPAKLGIGTAHLLAWLYALHHNFDVLITMDGDLSHDPMEIPSLLAKLDAANDLVVGSRYTKGGHSDYTGYRRWVSQAANIACGLLLQIGVAEFTTSYRAFRVKKLRELEFRNLLVSGYSFFFMTIVDAHLHGFRIVEVPIQFHNRNAGTSKIPTLEIFRGMCNLIRMTATRYFTRTTVDAYNNFTHCAVCGCDYSRLILSSGTNAGQMRGNRTTELCLFCGDRSAG